MGLLGIVIVVAKIVRLRIAISNPTRADVIFPESALGKRILVRVEDAYAVQIEWLQCWFGDRRGAWLYRRIRGVDSSEVDPHERRKSISSERTFSENINGDEELERWLMQQAGSVAGTLRHQ